jgi:hypothetical protein
LPPFLQALFVQGTTSEFIASTYRDGNTVSAVDSGVSAQEGSRSLTFIMQKLWFPGFIGNLCTPYRVFQVIRALRYLAIWSASSTGHGSKPTFWMLDDDKLDEG